jgi:hypothetical protein
MLHVGTTAHVSLNHFFNLWIVKSLSHFVNLYLDKFGGIIILILSCHPLSFFELSDMKAKVAHPVNVFFDLLSIIKTLLKHSFLFDLLKNTKLGHDFRVHAATLKIGRLGNLRGSFSLLTA